MTHSKKMAAGYFSKHACTLLIMAVILCISSLFTVQSLQAQQVKQALQSSPAKLKSFEGFYRFQNDQNAFLQISVKGNNLVLKQLWDGKEFIFEQQTPLDFYCKEQSFPLKFKDSAGSIIQVLAFDKDVWDKVKDYKPVVIKEIQLTPQQLKTFEGKYKMQGGDDDDFLQITAKGNNLILKQLWDGQEIVFVPLSPLDFFCKDRMFPLKFSKGEDGTVTQVLAFNKDVWIKVKENIN
jgi:hypothetical protein